MRLLFAILLLLGCDEEPKPQPHAGHGQDRQPVAGHEGHGSLPEGHAEVTIPADRQQLMGIKLGKAIREHLAGTIRATAIVRPEEAREAHVHTKLMGWVQDLYVNTVGQKVKKGQPLYSIYSQDLFVAEEEYLRARATNPTLAAAARERMRLWDIPEQEIAGIERDGPKKAIVLRAPISGTVLELGIRKGQYIEPEVTLYQIADLSRVWILADVYEFELTRLDRKGTATVRLQGATETFQAAIDYVYPTVDATTRTVKVRLVAENPRGELRPGSFATVELPTMARDAVTVPQEAIVDTGTRQLVYVALHPGHFRPVEVKVGQRGEGRAEIVSGISEGDDVVVGAQFLLDSESRLRGTSGPAPEHGGH